MALSEDPLETTFFFSYSIKVHSDRIERCGIKVHIRFFFEICAYLSTNF